MQQATEYLPGTAPEAPSYPVLPADVITQLLLLLPPRTILNARCASTLLRDPAAAAIAALYAHEGRLPRGAWQKFPAATRLCILPRKPSQESKYNNVQDAVEHLAAVIQLLAEAPKRVQDVVVLSLRGQWSTTDVAKAWTTACSKLLAGALLSSPCSSNIRILSIYQSITPSAAGMILRGLPKLQELSARVHADDATAARAGTPVAAAVTAPSGPSARRMPRWYLPAPASPHLQSLWLEAVSLQVDVAALASSARLHELDLTAGAFLNLAPALRGLSSSLAQLSLHTQASRPLKCEELDPDLGFLAGLSELQELTMPSVESTEEGWRVLASLPKLQRAKLWCVAVPALEDEPGWAPAATAGTATGVLQPSAVAAAAAAAAAVLPAPAAQACSSLVRVQLEDGVLLLPEEPQQVPGCLARRLPSLQHLEATVPDLPELLTALQGHTALRHACLCLEDQDALGQAQAAPQPQHCSSLAALQTLRLDNVSMDADVLLAALAACPALEELHVEWSDAALFEVQSKRQQQLIEAGGAKEAGLPAAQQGLAALAAGACSKTLRCLKVPEGWWFSPCEVAALLQGSMRALQVADVTVEVPRSWVGEAVVERRLPVLLGLCGAKVQGLHCQCAGTYEAMGLWVAKCRLLIG